MSAETLCAREGCGHPESTHGTLEIQCYAEDTNGEYCKCIGFLHPRAVPRFMAIPEEAGTPPRAPHGHITFAYDKASGDLIPTVIPAPVPSEEEPTPEPDMGSSLHCGKEGCEFDESHFVHGDHPWDMERARRDGLVLHQYVRRVPASAPSASEPLINVRITQPTLERTPVLKCEECDYLTFDLTRLAHIHCRGGALRLTAVEGLPHGAPDVRRAVLYNPLCYAVYNWAKQENAAEVSTLQAQQAENRITTATEVAHEYERQNDELRAEVASLRASLGETQRENAQLRKERSEPRLLPDGVSECPTCGAETNHDAFLLYSIDRVTRWRAECHPDDANCITIYDDALDEMRAELTSLLATPHPSETP